MAPPLTLAFSRSDLSVGPNRRIADNLSTLAGLVRQAGRDPVLFEEASSALEALQSDLSAVEDRWLSLAMLRDELEG